MITNSKKEKREPTKENKNQLNYSPKLDIAYPI